MSYQSERAEIEAFFASAIATARPALDRSQIGYDEHRFEPSRDDVSVRLTIASGAAEQMSYGAPGSNLVRHAGAVMIQLFAPADAGSDMIRELADDVIAIFINQTTTSVRFRVPYVSARQVVAPHLIWTIAVPFERDQAHG